MPAEWAIPGETAVERAHRWGLARAARDYLIHETDDGTAKIRDLRDAVNGANGVDGRKRENLVTVVESCPWLTRTDEETDSGRPANKIAITEAGDRALRQDAYREHPDQPTVEAEAEVAD